MMTDDQNSKTVPSDAAAGSAAVDYVALLAEAAEAFRERLTDLGLGDLVGSPTVEVGLISTGYTSDGETATETRAPVVTVAAEFRFGLLRQFVFTS